MAGSSTKAQLVSAASHLLDSGGQTAVTLRAVAERVGVSHNAPYRHFRDRSALLAAVAERDFNHLKEAFEEQDRAGQDAGTALRKSAAALTKYARDHPARYRLLFSDPDLSPEPGLKAAAIRPFEVFSRIVDRCQRDGLLPSVDTVSLTGLIYATLHGAIDLEIGGRASGSKGLGDIDDTAGLLFDLLHGAGTRKG